MIAVQGVYDNGRIQLSEAAPMEKAKVIVIFLEAEKVEKKPMMIDKWLTGPTGLCYSKRVKRQICLFAGVSPEFPECKSKKQEKRVTGGEECLYAEKALKKKLTFCCNYTIIRTGKNICSLGGCYE